MGNEEPGLCSTGADTQDRHFSKIIRVSVHYFYMHFSVFFFFLGRCRDDTRGVKLHGGNHDRDIRRIII